MQLQGNKRLILPRVSLIIKQRIPDPRGSFDGQQQQQQTRRVRQNKSSSQREEEGRMQGGSCDAGFAVASPDP